MVFREQVSENSSKLRKHELNELDKKVFRITPINIKTKTL